MNIPINLRALTKLKENKAVFSKMRLGFNEPEYTLELYFEKLTDEIGDLETIKNKLYQEEIKITKNDLPKTMKFMIEDSLKHYCSSVDRHARGVIKTDDFEGDLEDSIDGYDTWYLFYIFSDYIQLKKDGRPQARHLDYVKWGSGYIQKIYEL